MKWLVTLTTVLRYRAACDYSVVGKWVSSQKHRQRNRLTETDSQTETETKRLISVPSKQMTTLHRPSRQVNSATERHFHVQRRQ